ncbi:hypothetical protein F2Q69_00017015 [Brassica cretica]|uniref:Uncharacterized protein n=1 Tax=Brassica cretica TaxID=69181 RepID=A0A8S9QPK6_BRACR|nr:hypothetical protein F2Q69_00017015 [Brassica cretica]
MHRTMVADICNFKRISIPNMHRTMDPVIKGVVDLVEAEIVSQSQPLSDDGDSTGASTNLSLLQINEMVEKAVPKRKGGRLVGLARRASSYPASSSQASSEYTEEHATSELSEERSPSNFVGDATAEGFTGDAGCKSLTSDTEIENFTGDAAAESYTGDAAAESFIGDAAEERFTKDAAAVCVPSFSPILTITVTGFAE